VPLSCGVMVVRLYSVISLIDTSGSESGILSINTPDHPGVSWCGARAERAKCLEGEEVAIFALDLCPKFTGNWPFF